MVGASRFRRSAPGKGWETGAAGRGDPSRFADGLPPQSSRWIFSDAAFAERLKTAAEHSEVGWSDLGALIFLVFRRAGIDANKQQRTKGYSKTKGHICKQTEWEPW